MARCLRNELHLALELRPLLSRFTADYVLMSCWFSTRTVSPSAVLMLCICGIESCCGLSLTRLREQWLEFTAGKALVPVAAALDHERSAHSFITFFCLGPGCITFLCGSDRQAMRWRYSLRGLWKHSFSSGNLFEIGEWNVKHCSEISSLKADVVQCCKIRHVFTNNPVKMEIIHLKILSFLLIFDQFEWFLNCV